ncbi:MAG: undecaprenyl-diphosphate phosphatase [Candidatus Nanopelagicales bacterium]|nr:undecaprenyl-diphosphate phosphatase [Candidatus Nanopelagicales bacterium]
MSWYEAIVLGVLQGITEFLPVSSSAHLFIFSQFFGWTDPGAAFTAVSQIGTELAVIVYFWRDITRIVSIWSRSLGNPALRKELDARMGWYVIVGTIPVAALGFLFADQIETTARNLYLVAFTLIFFGVLLGIADRYGRKIKSIEKLKLSDAVVFGLGQALALIPGVSRSGATITTGLALGYNRVTATRYAFLLAIPAVFGSGFYEATKISDQQNVEWGQTILATVIAFFVGLGIISWLLRWLTTRTYTPFVIYRIGLGIVVLLLLATGVLSP